MNRFYLYYEHNLNTWFWSARYRMATLFMTKAAFYPTKAAAQAARRRRLKGGYEVYDWQIGELEDDSQPD